MPSEGIGEGHAASALAAARARRRCRLAILATIVIGLLVRAGLLSAAPQYGFLSDHLDFMVWSAWAYERGATRMYDLPQNQLTNTRLPLSMSPDAQTTPYPSLNRCNYPPLSVYLFWIQGWAWQAIDGDVVSVPVAGGIAKFAGFDGERFDSRVANTLTARSVNALVPILSDFLMAWGVLMLVRSLRRSEPLGPPEVIAFALTVLAPPVVLNSAFWTQMDSCLASMMVWCVYLVLTRRYALAGVCLGAALMIKPQAILLFPVLAYAFLAAIYVNGGSLRRAFGMWPIVPAAAATVVLVAAPFAIVDGGVSGVGWMRWFERSYAVPILEQFPYTTVRAFNVWWLDFLAHGQSAAALNTESTLLGMTKGHLGLALLAAAATGGAAACARRWRWERMSVAACAFVVMFAAFVFPTRVHERYVYYSIPFLIACSCVFPRWLPLVAALFVVGGFEMTWHMWLAAANAALDAPAGSAGAAAWSGMLAVLVLASFLYALGTLLTKRPAASTATPAPREESGRSQSMFGSSSN